MHNFDATVVKTYEDISHDGICRCFSLGTKSPKEDVQKPYILSAYTFFIGKPPFVRASIFLTFSEVEPEIFLNFTEINWLNRVTFFFVYLVYSNLKTTFSNLNTITT